MPAPHRLLLAFALIFGNDARADNVPIVVMPSAKRAARERGEIQPASYTVPASPSIPVPAAPKLWPIQVPELLPLPMAVPEEAKPVPAPVPIESPKPVSVVPLPPMPIPLPPQVPQSDLRLQAPEPRHNVKSSEPSPIRTPLTPPPGEMLMPLSLRHTALSALLGTGLVASTMFAQEPAITKKDVETTNTLLADIKKQLTDLKTKDFADLQAKIADLKEKEIAAMKADLEKLKDFKKQTLEALEGTDKGDGLLKKIAAIDEKLTALTKQMDSLDKKLESTRTALSSPIAKDAPKFGTVKLVNMYATDVDILVNGKGYRLLPSESKTLSLAPGTFTYQLLTGGGEEKKRTIKEAEEVLLKVN